MQKTEQLVSGAHSVEATVSKKSARERTKRRGDPLPAAALVLIIPGLGLGLIEIITGFGLVLAAGITEVWFGLAAGAIVCGLGLGLGLELRFGLAAGATEGGRMVTPPVLFPVPKTTYSKPKQSLRVLPPRQSAPALQAPGQVEQEYCVPE